MNTRLLAVAAAVSGVLLLLVLWLGWQGRSDRLSAERYADRLDDLTQTAHRLTSEVTKSRAGVVRHYDGLVQAEAGLRRKLLELATVPDFVDAQPRRALTEHLAALQVQVDTGLGLVDTFKRRHSVLRNSLRYLPVIARDFDAHPSMDAQALRTTVLVDDLIRDALLMQSWSDELIADRVVRHLGEIDQYLLAVSPSEQSRLALALSHVRKVAQLGPQVRGLTNQIIDLDLEARAATLEGAFDVVRLQLQASNERHWLLAYALGLLALGFGAAAVIARLAQSEAAQRQASERLSETVAALEVEQAKQQQLADLKSRFVAMTSHEFRTPLSVILSSSEMLEAYDHKWTPERKADHFGRIRTAALGMTRMLDSILLIGRSDSGLLRFEPRSVELSELCADVVDAVGQASGQRERIVWAAPRHRVEAEVDDGLLRHVLENLLNNALKYSPEALPVALDLRCVEHNVVFEVRDEGIGITDEDQAQLFETFHRGSNVGQRPGTGLGLAIVKRAVAAHGGQVSVQSSVGAGSTFTVEIPLVRGQSA